MAYDDNEVLQALQTKVVLGANCPLCDAGDPWRLAPSPALLPMLDDPDAGASVLPVICESCGFTRLFHTEVLVRE